MRQALVLALSMLAAVVSIPAAAAPLTCSHPETLPWMEPAALPMADKAPYCWTCPTACTEGHIHTERNGNCCPAQGKSEQNRYQCINSQWVFTGVICLIDTSCITP